MMISLWWCAFLNLSLLALFIALLTRTYAEAYVRGVIDGAFHQHDNRVKRAMRAHANELANAMFAAKGEIDHAILGQLMKKAEIDGEFV